MSTKQLTGSRHGILKVSNTVSGEGVHYARVRDDSIDDAPFLACKKFKKKSNRFAIDCQGILDGVIDPLERKNLLYNLLHFCV